MHHSLGVTMQVSCNTKSVLQSLKTNKVKHLEVVADARKGYLEKAKEKLEEKLSKINEGKVIDLRIDLSPPISHAEEYDTFIAMLEMHTEENILLSSDEVRMFVQDKWDWANAFLVGNSVYSAVARSRLDV